jgi:hypothetical protein
MKGSKMKKDDAFEIYMEKIKPYLMIESFKERQIRLALAASLFGEDAVEKVIDDLDELKIEHQATSDEYDYLVMVGSIINDLIEKLTEIEESHTDRYFNTDNGSGN